MGTAKDGIKRALYRHLQQPHFESALVAAHRLVARWPGVRRGLTKITPHPESYRCGEVRSARRDGCQWKLHLASYLQWSYFYGLPDPVLSALEAITLDGDHVLDVGANVGIYSVRISNRVGPKGKVVAFEPNPDARSLAEYHAQVNGVTNLVILPHALGSETAAANLASSQENDMGKYTLRPVSDQQNVKQAEIRRLDDMLPKLNLERVDTIKIDIEGSEPECLEGGLETILRHQPNLAIEVTPPWYGPSQMTSLKSHLRQISNMPYRWYEINETGCRPMMFPQWLEALTANHPQQNILALRPDRSSPPYSL